MSYTLPGTTPPDEYSESTAFLRCQGGFRLRVAVSNQAVLYQRGFGLVGGNVGDWQAEEELLPGLYSLTDPCDAVRFRAAVAKASLPAGAEAARVSVSVRTLEELTDG